MKILYKTVVTVIVLGLVAGFVGGPVFEYKPLFIGGLGTAVVCIVLLLLYIIWHGIEDIL